VARTLVLGARGYKPRRSDEIQPLYAYCTQYHKHYANDAEELKRFGLFNKSKASVAKLNASNHEPVFGITSMSNKIMINAKNTIMKERTWINRVAQRDDTNVNRSGEWFNMESKNLVPGDLVKLTLGDLIPSDCVGREIDLFGHVPDDRRVLAGCHERGRQGSHVKRVMRESMCSGTLGISPTMCGVA